MNNSAPFRELNEFSSDRNFDVLDKKKFDDFMPKEVFLSNCDVVTETYLNYDSVLFTEKPLKNLFLEDHFFYMSKIKICF